MSRRCSVDRNWERTEAREAFEFHPFLPIFSHRQSFFQDMSVCVLCVLSACLHSVQPPDRETALGSFFPPTAYREILHTDVLSCREDPVQPKNSRYCIDLSDFSLFSWESFQEFPASCASKSCLKEWIS